jgi:transposase
VKKRLQLATKRIWFLDEFSVHLAMSRTHARAPRGARAEVSEPFEKGQNISVIGALTATGAHAPMMIEGAIDATVLVLYVKHFLLPLMRRGDIVIWDNVPTHKSAQVLALFKATGMRVEPLPPYSPDFNPKEHCISKIKAELKRIRANTSGKLRNGLKRAYANVTAADCRGWLAHCGYAIH